MSPHYDQASRPLTDKEIAAFNSRVHWENIQWVAISHLIECDPILAPYLTRLEEWVAAISATTVPLARVQAMVVGGAVYIRFTSSAGVFQCRRNWVDAKTAQPKTST